MKINKSDLMRILREELTQHLTEAPVDMDMPDDMNTDMEVTRQDVEDEFEANTNQAEMARDLEMDQEPADMDNIMNEDGPSFGDYFTGALTMTPPSRVARDRRTAEESAKWKSAGYTGRPDDANVGESPAEYQVRMASDEDVAQMLARVREGINIDAIVDALNEVSFFPELPHKSKPEQEEPEEELKEGWGDTFDDMVQTGLAHAYDAVTPMSDINYSQRLKQDRQAANTPSTPSTSGLKATNQQNVFNRRMSQVQDPYNESQDSFKKTRNAANVNDGQPLSELEIQSGMGYDAAGSGGGPSHRMSRRDRRRARRAVGDYTKGPIDVQSSTEDVMDASGQRATDRIRTSNSAGTTDMTTVRSPGQPDRTRATITNPQGTITGERRPGLDFDLDAEDAAGSGERDFKTGATSVGGTYAESKQLQKESQDPFKRMRQLALKPYGSYRYED
jgi:hypothetical protein